MALSLGAQLEIGGDRIKTLKTADRAGSRTVLSRTTTALSTGPNFRETVDKHYKEQLMKRALVTLAVGERYLRMFDRYCRDLWEAYADRHRMDLVVLSRALDDSPRARSRSASWQKCLVLSAPEITSYEQVVWTDADVLINPESPDVAQDVPVDRIGAVDEYATPTREDYEILLRRKYAQWSASGIPYVSNLTPTEYHAQFGLKGHFESVVQAGALVMSPRFHRELFEHIYHHYKNEGRAEWNFEMRPLSYEILTNGWSDGSVRSSTCRGLL